MFNDAVNLTLQAAVLSSQTDNYNDPSQLSPPPYHVIIAKKNEGIYVLNMDEIELRYERIRYELQNRRGYIPVVERIKNRMSNGGGER